MGTRMRLNPFKVASCVISNWWETYKIRVPASCLKIGRNCLTFGYTYTTQPAILYKSKDYFYLAVRFRAITIESDRDKIIEKVGDGKLLQHKVYSLIRGKAP